VENDIHNLLRYHQDHQSLHFYRTTTKQEIDFIIKRGTTLIPVEVKYRTKIPPIDMLDTFAEEYTPAVTQSIIVTRDICRVEGTRYSLPACMMGLIRI
jgi:predicted AAA+ superfamily ATPase